MELIRKRFFFGKAQILLRDDLLGDGDSLSKTAMLVDTCLAGPGERLVRDACSTKLTLFILPTRLLPRCLLA